MAEQLVRSQAQSLHFVLLDVNDFNTPVTTHTYASLICMYGKQGAGTLVSKTLTSGNTRHLGDGIYEIDFTSSELDTIGAFSTELYNSSGTPVVRFYRSDRVASATIAGAVGRVVTIGTQTSGALPIPNAQIQVRGSAGVKILAEALSDVGGILQLLLPDATYKVWVWKPGYTFTNPTTIVVTADATTNIVGTSFAPTNPGGPTLTTVYGWLLDTGGVPRSGISVQFQPVLEGQDVRRPYGISSVTKLLSRYTRSVVTDVNGYFEVLLTPNSLITPAGTKYAVTFSDVPQDRALITVAAGGPLNFYDLLA